MHEPQRIFPLRPFLLFRNPSFLPFFARPCSENTHLHVFSLLVRSFVAFASSSAATSLRPRHEPVRSTWRFVVWKPKRIPFRRDGHLPFERAMISLSKGNPSRVGSGTVPSIRTLSTAPVAIGCNTLDQDRWRKGRSRCTFRSHYVPVFLARSGTKT